MRSTITEVEAPEIDQLAEIYTVVTDPEGSVLSVNDALAEMLAIPPEELFGHPFTRFFPEKDFLVPAGGLISMFNNNSFFKCGTTFYKSPPSRAFSFRWTVTRLHTQGSSGTLLQWCGVCTNNDKNNQ